MDRYSYLKLLAEQIRTKRARPKVLEEVEAHIEDQKISFLAEGMTEEEAEEAAVREMGDPVEAGTALDRVHRPKMAWNVLAIILVISVVSVVIQIAVTMCAHPEGFAGRWTAVWQDGVGKSLAGMAAGILLILVICRADYMLLARYAAGSWVLLNVLLIYSVIFGPVINGRPFYTTHVSCLLVPFYAGVLYHFRGRREKGLAICIAYLMVPLIILLFSAIPVEAVTVGTVGLLLLHLAVWRKWFGENRKHLYLCLWTFTLLLPAAFLLLYAVKNGGFPLAEYQLARIDAWLHPGKYEDYDMLRILTAEAGAAVKDKSSWITGNTLIEIKSSYLWTFLFGYLGTWRGTLLTVVVASFWGLLLYAACRQKNQFGFLVSVGSVAFLIIQTILYIGMNLGNVPGSGSIYMPFFSNGNAFLLISYFYMGLLLSVCRNSRIAEI